MGKCVTRGEFEEAMEAVWSEIQYQNSLPRRTDDEAKSIPSFCKMGEIYSDRAAVAWNDQQADEESGQVEDALHAVRKCAAIYLRGMVYCGVRYRKDPMSLDENGDLENCDLESPSNVRTILNPKENEFDKLYDDLPETEDFEPEDFKRTVEIPAYEDDVILVDSDIYEDEDDHNAELEYGNLIYEDLVDLTRFGFHCSIPHDRLQSINQISFDWSDGNNWKLSLSYDNKLLISKHSGGEDEVREVYQDLLNFVEYYLEEYGA